MGNHFEAEVELEEIAPELPARPDVLQTRWAVYAKAQKWDAAADIGRILVEMAPGDSFGWLNRSYALRRASGGGLQATYDALWPAADRLTDLEMVLFNLACYACQLGRIYDGREWLAKSFAAAERKGRLDHARLHALDEPDLELLWKVIGSIRPLG